MIASKQNDDDDGCRSPLSFQSRPEVEDSNAPKQESSART